MDFSNIFNITLESLLMTLIAAIISYLIGLPMGIVLYSSSKNGLRPNKWLNTILGFVVNVLRSIPCLIIVVICLPLVRLVFGIGTGKWYTIVIPLVITSVGFVARMVEQSLCEVSYGKIEAIRSLGATDFQIIMHVLIPESRSSLVLGISVVLVSLLGYTSFAYNIGAGGLISGIWTYYTRHTGDYQTKLEFWVMIIVVVLLVELFQQTGLIISKKIDKRRI